MFAPWTVDDSNSVTNWFNSNECIIGRWKWTVLQLVYQLGLCKFVDYTSGGALSLGIFECATWAELECNRITSPKTNKWECECGEQIGCGQQGSPVYVGEWISIVPPPTMFRWKQQKSQLEMDLDSWKFTWSHSKLQVFPTYRQPKPNGFQNNNDRTNKTREPTDSVSCCDYWCGWYQQAPNQNNF